MKRKPVVGETLHSLNIGNAYNRHYGTQKLTPVVVKKVGREYFTVETLPPYAREDVFRLRNWIQKADVCANAQLYESPQEWEDEKEGDEAADFIWRFFQYGKPKTLTRAQLRAIREIILQPAS